MTDLAAAGKAVSVSSRTSTGSPPGQSRRAGATRPLSWPLSSAPALAIETELARAAVARVRVRGEIDLVTAPLLERHLKELLVDERRSVWLDLAGIGFMGVAGVRVLLESRAAPRTSGVQLHVTGHSRQVARVCRLVGVDLSLLHEDGHGP